MLFLLRHGERADKAGPEEKEKISIKCDPHLTDLGKLQARKAGDKIVKLLKDYYKESGLKSEELKYLIISSPFRRCIETAYNVSQAFPKESIYGGKIYLNDYLCDYLGDFHPEEVLKFQVRTNPEELQKHVELDLQDGFPEIGNHAYAPIYPEGTLCIRKRVSEGHFKIKPFYINEINKDSNVVLILVTHGFVVECFLELYKGLDETRKVNYTSLSQIVIDPSDLKGKVLVAQDHEHLKEADEEYMKLKSNSL